jgi:transcriptional regulator with XRE-family HTH domain
MNWRDKKNADHLLVEFNMDIGIALKRIRLALGITQPQLAQLTGLSDAMISYMESGKKSPSAETRHHIALALGLTQKQLELLSVEDLSQFDDDLKRLAEATHEGLLEIVRLQHHARRALGVLTA